MTKLPFLVVFTYLTLSGAQNTDEDVRDQFKDVITELWGTPNTTNATPRPTGGSGTSWLGGTDKCVCVPYYNCDPDTNKIIRDGSVDGFGKIDIR